MTAYTRGSRYERLTADLLTRDGYHCWLARGSKGLADVLAIKRGQLLLVQVKSGRGVPRDGLGVNHAGWNGLYDLATELGPSVLAVVCYWQVGHPREPIMRQVTGHHGRGLRHWPSKRFEPDELAPLRDLSTRASFNTDAARKRRR
jgi:hypothetical protein